MAKNKSEYEKAVGKLISAIQKEWGNELGGINPDFSQRVMDLAHNLLQARTPESARKLLGSLSVRQYLGDVWVQSHPNLVAPIVAVENSLKV